MDGFKYYKQWVNKRDEYLELILNRYRKEMTIALHDAFIGLVSAAHQNAGNEFVAAIIRNSATQLANIFHRMRRDVLEFTTASEIELMSRIHNTKYVAKAVSSDRGMPSGGEIYDKVGYYLRKLYRKLDDIGDYYRAKKEPVPIIDLIMALPKMKKVTDLRAPLKKVKESDDDQILEDFSVQFLTDDDWDRIAGAWERKVVPLGRDPETYFFGGKGRSKEDRVYGWELENDLRQDFVQHVRDGQVEALKIAGVTDFVWIAILDDRTDECCEWRDGLTSQEISQKLKTSRKGDECQVIVPPAHFNCRCTMAPASEHLPEVPTSNAAEFEEWLNT